MDFVSTREGRALKFVRLIPVRQTAKDRAIARDYPYIKVCYRMAPVQGAGLFPGLFAHTARVSRVGRGGARITPESVGLVNR
jgi:hypothetical protein